MFCFVVVVLIVIILATLLPRAFESNYKDENKTYLQSIYINSYIVTNPTYCIVIIAESEPRNDPVYPFAVEQENPENQRDSRRVTRVGGKRIVDPPRIDCS